MRGKGTYKGREVHDDTHRMITSCSKSNADDEMPDNILHCLTT